MSVFATISYAKLTYEFPREMFFPCFPCAVGTLLYIPVLEAVYVGDEGVGDSYPDVVTRVVESLQQIRVHNVEPVLVQVRPNLRK